MNDISNICRILFFLHFNKKITWGAFLLSYCQRNGAKTVEQFLTHTADMHLQSQRFVEQRLGWPHFQDPTMVDDRHTVTQGLYIGKLMRIEEDTDTLDFQLPQKVPHVALPNRVQPGHKLVE